MSIGYFKFKIYFKITSELRLTKKVLTSNNDGMVWMPILWITNKTNRITHLATKKRIVLFLVINLRKKLLIKLLKNKKIIFPIFLYLLICVSVMISHLNLLPKSFDAVISSIASVYSIAERSFNKYSGLLR